MAERAGRERTLKSAGRTVARSRRRKPLERRWEMRIPGEMLRFRQRGGAPVVRLSGRGRPGFVVERASQRRGGAGAMAV